MKNKLYIFSVIALLFIMSNCGEGFLDEEPTRRLSPEQIAEAAESDPSVWNGFTAGLYSTMYITGTGGTTGHDDFGQKGYDIFSDMIVSDMVLAGTNYGWYTNIARFQATVNNTLNSAYQPWRYYYRIIFSANSLIEVLGGNDAEQTDIDRQYIMGQAKAMRAYAYFYLSQFYSTGYNSGTETILPLYTDTQVPAQPLSTSEVVYNQIIKDLYEAVSLLEGFNRSAKNEVNQDVAKGLLCYALAARGTNEDLEEVVRLTDEIILAGRFRLLVENEVVALFDEEGSIINRDIAGFNNVASPSWMWGVDLTLDNELDLISWWGQVDLFTYSYAWAGDPKTIDEGLYNSIREDDVRKGQFDPEEDLMPINKFYAPDRAIGGQRYIVTDYVYMRLEEMYLLNAEANARLGADELAIDKLKELLELRIDDYSYIDDLSGEALLDEIYFQTRVELWGEGKSYLAMKRLKKTITRGPNHLFNAGDSFAWDANELTFPIPQAELLNNPALQ